MKKLLALVLALVMSMSLVTISNAAFSDADKIDHTEAVEVMNALGVINGMPDGSFAPAGNVTRAEMAKMISIIMLGDIDAAAFVGTTTDLKDINGHWAEGYIKYCYSQGVIAGRGDGTFAPNANVTAVEAAKMLCVAIGYNATVQGYVGGDWAINIIRDAQLSKLFDDLSVASTKVLTRDEAAQMIYNAINAKMIEKKPSISITNGNITYSYEQSDSKTLLSETFGAKTFIGTLTGNDKTVGACNKGEVQVNGKLDTAASDASKENAQFPSDISLSNIGEEVKVIFKDGKGGIANKPDKKDTIYGVFNNGATTVYNVTKDDIQDVDTANDKIKFGDVKYDYVVAAGNNVVTNYGKATVALDDTSMDALKVDNADSIKFVCNSDGKIIGAYVTARTFDVVAAVNNEKVQLRANGTLKIEDHDIYDGIAKDDIVVVTQYYSNTASDATFVVEKAELKTGTMTKYYNSTKVAIDGSNVERSATNGALTDGDGSANYDKTTFSNADLGKDFELVMYGTRFVAAKALTETSKDYAVILAATDGDAINGQTVKLLLADGSKQTYSIHEDSKVGNTAFASDAGKYFSTAAAGMTDLKATGSVGYNKLVSYVIENDGKVNMTALTTAGAAGSYAKDTKTVTTSAGGYLTTADAVAFVFFGDEWKVYKASALQDITGTTMNIQYTLKSNKVPVFAIQANDAVGVNTSDYAYMYVTAAPFAYEENDKKYTDVVGITADGAEVTLKFENDKTTESKLAKGAFIQYKVGSDGLTELTNVTELTMVDRVTEYDADRKILVLESAGTLPVASDVVIVNVNCEDGKAGSATGISVKDPVNTGNQNVVYLTANVNGVANTVIAIFVDDNKDISLNTVTMTGTPTAAAIMRQLKAGTVNLTGTLPAGVTVKDGETLILNNNVAYDLSTITGEVGATVTFTDVVATNASNYGSFYTAAGSTPTLATAASHLAGKTYVYVADVDTDAGDTTPGFLKQ